MKHAIAALSAAALLGGCAASPAHESTGEHLDDMAITTEVETGLLDGEGIWTADIIHVETVQGVVHLSGYAATEHNRRRAGEIAQSVAGAGQVENGIRLR